MFYSGVCAQAGPPSTTRKTCSLIPLIKQYIYTYRLLQCYILENCLLINIYCNVCVQYIVVSEKIVAVSRINGVAIIN